MIFVGDVSALIALVDSKQIQYDASHDGFARQDHNDVSLLDTERINAACMLRQRSVRQRSIKVAGMKAEYGFSKMKSRRNPYASKLKKPVTMRLSEDVVAYFKGMANEAGVPYGSLINLYLRDCLSQNRRVEIKWPSAA
jgi:uncharacterized protein (DUF4415 family)